LKICLDLKKEISALARGELGGRRVLGPTLVAVATAPDISTFSDLAEQLLE